MHLGACLLARKGKLLLTFQISLFLIAYYNRQHYHVLCHKENHPLTGSPLMPDLVSAVSLIWACIALLPPILKTVYVIQALKLVCLLIKIPFSLTSFIVMLTFLQRKEIIQIPSQACCWTWKLSPLSPSSRHIIIKSPITACKHNTVLSHRIPSV